MNLTRMFVCSITLLLGAFHGFSQDFTIDSYTVDVYIDEAGYFDVIEMYDVKFNFHKHGIFRDIQTRYSLLTEDGRKEQRQIVISKVEVPSHKFEASGKFSQKIKGTARIKIGDPDKTVIGPVHYGVRYRVENAFLFEQNFTRFYWNLKPPDWYAPFNEIAFNIHLPNKITLDQDDVLLYTGPVGSTSPSIEFEMHVGDGLIKGRSKSGFVSNRGESITILLNLPVNSIAENKPFWPFWTHYGWLLILGTIALFYYFVFRKFGKDDPAPASITYFPPENMDPAMVGFLINDKEDTTDLISLLPYWGTKGMIEIEEIDKKGWFAKDDTRIIKAANIPADAPDYQRTVYDGLFGAEDSEVLVSSLKNSFYTTMGVAKNELKVAAQKYYDPMARRVYWYMIIGIIVIHIILLPIFFYYWGILALVTGLGFCLLLLLLNRFMVKKNPKGTALFSELKGFRAFIKTAESNRLNMLIQESPNYFESTMAYALTFGVFKQWAKKFESLDIPPPKWYHSAGTQMGMHHFSRSFSNTIHATSTNMVSSPSNSSSGGGSSGGGFGGGGGGSW